ncbi:hypothetical protein ACFC00_03600 [Streptomyces adustus]|uniref:hypothetical protein n=1 Tax=Streptomyces adustus TaxID=1609272 RepID=UPI0035DA539D
MGQRAALQLPLQAGLVADLEAGHGLEPDPLSPSPPGVGRTAALRISHPTGTTEATRTPSGEQPDIT